jgi:hypothetical protein
VSSYLENLVFQLQHLVDILDGVYQPDTPEAQLVAEIDAALGRWTKTGPARRRHLSPVTGTGPGSAAKPTARKA